MPIMKMKPWPFHIPYQSTLKIIKDSPVQFPCKITHNMPRNNPATLYFLLPSNTAILSHDKKK
jgi:hypothetical protein